MYTGMRLHVRGHQEDGHTVLVLTNRRHNPLKV